jgi:hypothetical protein
MRALLQRSGPASVEIAGRTVGWIDHGLVVLVCAMPSDTEETAVRLAGKIAALRIFADAAGRMNRSVRDTGAATGRTFPGRRRPTTPGSSTRRSATPCGPRGSRSRPARSAPTCGST